jgi:hypothetical protein
VYTSTHHLPNDAAWVPTAEKLLSMVGFFKPQFVSVCGYGRRLRWQAPPPYVLNIGRATPEEAVARLGQPRVLHLALNGAPWSKQIEQSLGEIVPTELARGYVAWDVHIHVGPQTIPDQLCERTLCSTHFSLSISGDGVPADLHKYLDLWLATPPAQAMIDMLHRVSGGMGWRSVISANI